MKEDCLLMKVFSLTPVSNEISLELLPESLVADLYRIMNVKNQLAEKHKHVKFL